MALTAELKILDDKIKANQAHYDLDREEAKIYIPPEQRQQVIFDLRLF